MKISVRKASGAFPRMCLDANGMTFRCALTKAGVIGDSKPGLTHVYCNGAIVFEEEFDNLITEDAYIVYE